MAQGRCAHLSPLSTSPSCGEEDLAQGTLLIWTGTESHSDIVHMSKYAVNSAISDGMTVYVRTQLHTGAVQSNWFKMLQCLSSIKLLTKSGKKKKKV